MPKLVVAHGGGRSDAGMLGFGLYFGSHLDTSVQYTTPGKTNTRLMMINRVSLGNTKDFYQFNTSLVEPPPKQYILLVAVFKAQEEEFLAEGRVATFATSVSVIKSYSNC